MGSEGVQGASAPCRPRRGGRTRKGAGVPVGGPLRAVGRAAGGERCSGAEVWAGYPGSGIQGLGCPRQARGGACGPAGGRWPH